MASSTPSRGLTAALFTLVPLAYLSMRFWRPQTAYGPTGAHGMPMVCTALMIAVFVVSAISWNAHRIAAILGLLACLLWLIVFLLPVL